MKTVKFKDIKRVILTTNAQPTICLADDGNLYYTKFLEGRGKNKELINEYVAYKLAKILKLPIPEAVFIELDDNSNINLNLDDKLVQVASKLAFGSKELKNVLSIMDRNTFSMCQNKDCLLSIIVFDIILCNTDRDFNKANMLYKYIDKLVYIIDHGRIFDLGTIWDEFSCRQRKNDVINVDKFLPGGIYYMIRESVNLYEQHDDCIKRFSNVSEEIIRDIFLNIPNEWNCTGVEKEEAIEYLVNRFKQYEQVISQILAM